ncbi:MAG: LCP family protein [Actinobacteria bacterium]|nr:LCP family protein [Actinomycetota bacterium]
MTFVDPPMLERSRTWPQRLLMSVNALLLLGGLFGAGGLGYFYLNLGKLGRLDLSINDSRLPDEPMNILLVGSDSRAFVDNEGEAEAFGTTAGPPKSDTIMLVRVDAKAATATMLSFPRDLWVKVADLNRFDRINVAFNSASQDPAAGAQRLIKTIQQNFGIPVHHYAQIDFAGFKSLVDAIGGVEFFFPAPVRDWDYHPADGGRARSMTGLEILTTGCVHLDGAQALGYVRSRHFQTQIDGRWQIDPSGDFGRIDRQQNFIRRVAKEALSKGLTDPRKLNSLVKVAAKNVNVDEGFAFNDMVAIGKQFRSLSPDAIRQLQLPADSARKGRASVVEITNRAAADQIFDIFRGVDPSAPKVYGPADVRVRVLNGSRRAGEALSTSQALVKVGFAVTDTGNGASTKVTTIRYGSGQLAKAEVLNRYLATPAVLREDVNLTVDAVLTTGTDFSGILPTPRAPDAAPPTTAPPAPGPTAAPVRPGGGASTTVPATTTTTIPEC